MAVGVVPASFVETLRSVASLAGITSGAAGATALPTFAFAASIMTYFSFPTEIADETNT